MIAITLSGGDGRSVRKYSDRQKQRCKYYMHDSSFRVIRCKGIAGSNSGSSIKKIWIQEQKFHRNFSILAIMDVLYSYYFANDSYFKTQKI